MAKGYLSLPAPREAQPSPQVRVVNIDWHGRGIFNLQGDEIMPGQMTYLNRPHAQYWIDRGRVKIVADDDAK